MIIGDLIKRNAQLFGRKPALVFEGRRYTHAELAARIYRLANALAARGLERQQRIAILARNCNECLEAFGAAEVCGFIAVNLNHRLSERELIEICRDCLPAVLIFAAELAPAAAGIRSAVDGIRTALAIDGPVAGAEDYETVLADSNDREPILRAAPTDIVYLIYTSGSTGRPKGVMFDHPAFIEAARILSHEGGARADDTTLIVMPLFHVGAKIEMMAFWILGATIVLHPAFDVTKVIASIQRERITAAHLAPLMIQRILEAPNLGSYDLSTLRNVHYASAPMPVALLRRALDVFGPIFTQVYGMTECPTGSMLKASQHRPDGNADESRRLSSAGQVLLDCELRVVRADASECAKGEIGEILIRSRATMRGYWSNTPATIEALRDGWMHTQDLGFVDDEGFLFVVDRKKDMIISGGENVYCWEVEEALRTHPAVAEAAVIGVPDPEWGEAVKACIVLRDGARSSAAELIQHCRANLASYKKPRTIDFVDVLPRLFNGKIDKKALRAPYWRGRDREVS